MSTQNLSFHLSSNHPLSLSAASWSSTSTFNSPWPESPAKVRLLLPRYPVMGFAGSSR